MPRRTLDTKGKENLGLSENNESVGSRLVAPGWSKIGTPQQGPKTDVDASERIVTSALNNLKSSVAINNIILDTLGPESERETYHKDVLKRTRPAQRVTGYAKTYLDEETKRLAGAVKKMKADNDKLVIQLDVLEKQCVSNVGSVEEAVQSLAASARDTKARASKYLTKTRRLEKDLTEMQSQLEDATKQFESEQDKQKTLEEQNRSIVQENLGLNDELKQAKESLLTLQKSHDDLERDLDDSKAKLENLEENQKAENEELKSKVSSLEIKYAELQSSSQEKIEKLQSESASTTTALENMRMENLTLQKELEHTKTLKTEADRTIESLESKQNSRDSHLEKVLETLQQAQTFSQERIERLSQEKKELEDQLSGQGDHKAKLDNELVRKEGELKVIELQLDQTKSELSGAQNQLAEASEALSASQLREKELSQELTTTQASYIKLRNEHARMCEQVEAASSATSEELTQLRKSAEEHQAQRDALESELAAMKATYDGSGEGSGSSSPAGEEDKLRKLCEVSKEAEMLKRRVNGLSEVEHKMKALEAELLEARQRLFKADAEKRKLHNTVQDLRGNVRVVARARPVPAEAAGGEHLEFHPDGTGIAVKVKGTDATASKSRVSRHGFQFNRVFPGETSQSQVFEEVSSFVQSALDGYNVCLFSYGQTGAGKTHTMTGTSSSLGIIPRSVDKILEQVYQMRAKGWNMEIRAMFIEIYNETIRDLLAKPPKKDEKPPKHDIRHANNRFEVKDALTVPITESEHVHQLLDRAAANRSVAATKSNAQSSRSHSVFTLYIDGKNEEFGASIAGSLSLCDLAGSERLDKSGATGDRLKETQAINKSLSALANVFDSMKKGSGHVPFRNSKLTYLLQPCFANGGKSMMIVNLSSEEQHVGETLCSLRFAENVNQTVIKQAPACIKDKNGQTRR